MTQQILNDVRAAANGLTSEERGAFARDLVREVYDAEKFNGEGGEGLDGRDSRYRRSLGRVLDEAESTVVANSGSEEW